jgi:NhaP-type Na+/H+ and K+/H+ antiporters
MLTSLALMFLVGMFSGWLFGRLGLPSLLGMLMTGILLGPYAGNLLDGSILGISADLRQLALIIILTRAGLALDVNDLKQVGRPAILMCFVPASAEILGVMLLAPRLLGVSLTEALVMGAVLAAVSPAVVVPKMLQLMEAGYGTEKSIPQMIMAGASVDDVFVIVIFTAAVGLAQGASVHAVRVLQIPLSIATGLLVGVLLGAALAAFFAKVHLRDSVKVVILLSLSFLLVALEKVSAVPFSGLLAVMSMSAALQKKRPAVAKRLSAKYGKLWVGAELWLFVLVGATVDLQYAVGAGAMAVVLIFGVMVFRMAGVWLSLLRTALTVRERMFCMVAYMPKATVQAAIGSIPLGLGLGCGNMVLTVAVLSILITAPLGALGIEGTYRRWLGRGN